MSDRGMIECRGGWKEAGDDVKTETKSALNAPLCCCVCEHLDRRGGAVLLTHTHTYTKTCARSPTLPGSRASLT